MDGSRRNHWTFSLGFDGRFPSESLDVFARIRWTFSVGLRNTNALDRLRKLSEKRDRSLNYLVVEAIIEYLEREEKK